MESVKNEWDGDVDLSDGEVQKQQAAYLKQLELINGLCQNLIDPQEKSCTIQDLHSLRSSLSRDGVFIDKGIQRARVSHACKSWFSKVAFGNAMDNALYKLGWNVDELSRLNNKCHALYVNVTSILDSLMDQSINVLEDNISRSLNALQQQRLLGFTRGVTFHKRRNRKPYAIPVSYASLQEKQAREIINNVIKEMNQRDIKRYECCRYNI